MAYADPLDPSTPGDPDIAGQGDDEIRKKTRAIRQRLASFFVDVDADPLVPKHLSIPLDIWDDDTVDGHFLAVASVPADRIVGGGGGGAPGPNSVGTTELQTHSVTNDKLADNSVDDRVLAPGAIGPTALGADSVNTTNLIDEAVTRPKLVAAMRGVLGYVTKGSFNIPAGNMLVGPTYHRTFNIPVVINAVAAPGAMAIVSSATLGGAGIIWDALVTGANIVVHARDVDNDGTKDLSGTVLHWMVIQPYEGAVHE